MTYADFNLLHVAIIARRKRTLGADYEYNNFTKTAEYWEFHLELKGPYYVDDTREFKDWYSQWEDKINGGYKEIMTAEDIYSDFARMVEIHLPSEPDKDVA